MDASESTETRNEGLSININAPCNNKIAGRDYIEVNIHLNGRPKGDHAAQDQERGSSSDEETIETGDLATGTMEVLVPKALRIARQIRTVESSGL